LAKIAVIFFTAGILDARFHRVNDLRHGLAPIVLVVAPVAGLILLEPDFGTAFTLLLTVGVMVFAAGLSWRYVAGVALATLPVMWLVVASADYRLRRVLTFLDPWRDPLGDGFQIIQSLIAVGTGGIGGRGPWAARRSSSSCRSPTRTSSTRSSPRSSG
jgi:cell division protein FtsW